MNKFCILVAGLVMVFAFVPIEENPPSFSKDQDLFFKELHQFLNAKTDKEALELINSIRRKADSGLLGEKGFSEMVDICNSMSSLRMPATPYYRDYLKGLSKIKINDIKVWQDVILKLLEKTRPGKLKPVKKFFSFSLNFFEGGHLRLSKSGISWKLESVDFQMKWEKEQPVLDFEKSSLTANRKGNEMTIVNASGYFLPLENKWIGRGGKVSWKRLDETSQISANLLEYQIDLAKNEYTAEKAFLSYPKYFNNKVIEGKFKDKLLINNKSKTGSFPRFESKSGDLNLKNIAPGANFTGGIKITGLTVTGYNPEKENAVLEYHPPKTSLKTKLAASSFSIKTTGEIVAASVKSTMYFGTDSLYHPSINIKLTPGKKMTFYSSEKSASKAPFFDSRQQLYFYAKKIEWNIEKNQIQINPSGGGDRSVTLESEHFYDKNYMYRIQNVANLQPVILLYLMSRDEGNTIDANYFAKRLNPNFNISNIKTLIFDLERHGFLRYSTDNQSLTITPKVAHYAESHGEHKDFDIIKIKSEHALTNAIYDLGKEELIVEGVENVMLQNRQKVGIKPAGKRIVLKKNREIDFNGKIFAGLTNLAGDKCSFDYKNFRIKVDSVRFFDIYMPSDPTYEFKDQKSYGIGSRIENTSGYLLINAPDNKSGKEESEDYPAFQTEAHSYVYYEEANEQKGAYKKEKFYFELEPFKLTNLAKPKPEDLQFEGNFVSGGIFPAFKETLTLQKDQSLGFQSKSPDAGYEIFDKKGNFTGEISLSNKGLLGKGKVNYSGTAVESEDLVFKPNQVIGSAEYFHLEEDKENSVPEVKGQDVTIDWKPYTDSMIVSSNDKSFELFNEGEHAIGGVLISTPTGLKGRGIFEWGAGEMDANLFDFGAFAVQSEKTDLKIKAMETDALAFDTKDLEGSIDFETKKGQFKSNDKSSLTKMPANHFVTTLNEFEWDLGKKALTFVAEIGKKGDFFSTHPEQDSLYFQGTTANYDFETGLLKIEGVDKIQVSDASVVPDKKIVKVKTGGYLQKFENALIIANRENQYHKFTNASVNIAGKHTYEATGTYEYKVGDLIQMIEFPNITGRKRGKGRKSEKKSTTQAQKSIAEADNFRLDAKTFFYGSIDLDASNPFLQFAGYAQMDAPILTNPQWFRVDFEGDKNKLLISADKPKNPNGAKLYSGIYMNKESKSNYATILMPLNEPKDRCLFDANGVLKYDSRFNNFVFGNELKMANDLNPGNTLIFSEKTGKVTAKGSFNICPNVRGAEIKLAGIAETGLSAQHLQDSQLANENLSGKFVAKIDFKLPKSLMKLIENDFLNFKDSVRNVVYKNKEVYGIAIKEWVENPNYKGKALSELNINSNFKIKEKKASSTFILGELNMKWNTSKQSFISSTDSISLATLNGQSYNKKIAALVALTTPANEDDRIYILLRTPGKNYYYFNYKKGILHVQSNNSEFNDKVEGMSEKERTIKLKGGDTYEVQLTTPDIVGNFRRNIEAWKSEPNN